MRASQGPGSWGRVQTLGQALGLTQRLFSASSIWKRVVQIMLMPQHTQFTDLSWWTTTTWYAHCWADDTWIVAGCRTRPTGLKNLALDGTRGTACPLAGSQRGKPEIIEMGKSECHQCCVKLLLCHFHYQSFFYKYTATVIYDCHILMTHCCKWTTCSTCGFLLCVIIKKQFCAE